ncbi:mitochondrial metal transporter 2 [Periconia macrospinosa]|uniref:Mitochondrial metal transporter 2 n=1 Tax=Periconia macrospinosa TaxID=97972 RepID=A0A2V1DR29_9PLEO|nr:mitochondrial metal transporter 2 [Periconia macrospinosa]
MSTTETQTRTHVGHAHGHGHGHHHHDNTYLVSKNKNDAGVRITRIGLFVNLGMAIGKGAGGYFFHSQALVADAVHSLTDLVSDIMTLATVSWSLKPPSERFPSGYGKVESLGSLGVSGILLGGGVMMGWAALIALAQHIFPEAMEIAAQWGLMPHSHHHHGVGEMGPSIHAAWLAGGSILIKEWLYRATLKVANERKSSVLASNAYHHRVDSLTAFVALLMIAGSNVLTNASWMDPVGGLVISLMVIQAGLGNTKAALYELADVGVEEEMRQNVQQAATKALADFNSSSASDVQVRHVQGIKSGQNYLMDIELGAPASWTIEQTRGVESLVRERVGAKVRGVKKVRVRFVANTSDQPDFMDEFIQAKDGSSLSPEPEVDQDHQEHDHNHSHGSKDAEKSAKKRR